MEKYWRAHVGVCLLLPPLSFILSKGNILFQNILHFRHFKQQRSQTIDVFHNLINRSLFRRVSHIYVHRELSYIIIMSSCEIHLNKYPFTHGILYVHTILLLHWSTGLQIEWCQVITSGHNPVISNKQQIFLSGFVGRRSYGFTDICSRLRNIIIMLSMSLWHGHIEAWKWIFLNENVWFIFSHTLLLQRFTNSAVDHLYGAVYYNAPLHEGKKWQVHGILQNINFAKYTP